MSVTGMMRETGISNAAEQPVTSVETETASSLYEKRLAAWFVAIRR